MIRKASSIQFQINGLAKMTTVVHILPFCVLLVGLVYISAFLESIQNYFQMSHLFGEFFTLNSTFWIYKNAINRIAISDAPMISELCLCCF